MNLRRVRIVNETSAGVTNKPPAWVNDAFAVGLRLVLDRTSLILGHCGYANYNASSVNDAEHRPTRAQYDGLLVDYRLVTNWFVNCRMKYALFDTAFLTQSHS
jgi:hypothetical protein